jgi:hypothetical protein
MAPALFTQLALQLDPLAILGLAMADGTPRTSKSAAEVNDQVAVRERFILQLLYIAALSGGIVARFKDF